MQSILPPGRFTRNLRLTQLRLCALTMMGALCGAAQALEGTATYSPAESNIAAKYWVSSSATSGDAKAALDGKLETTWTPTDGQADLTVDLGGAYDAVHKVRLHFADHDHVYRYRLLGSADNQQWKTLADRTEQATRGGVFTDIFSYPGLRYIRLELTGDPAGGVREMEIINYLRPNLQNGSDTSEQGGDTNAYYYNAGNNPPVPGIRGGRFSDSGSIEAGNNFFGLTKDLGWDMTRLRVWNEPRNEKNGQPNNSPGDCSPANTLRVAKAVVGAGQTLGIDFHYADSWSDPQKQTKPYAWADLPFEQLQQKTHDFTAEFVENLIEQGTTPGIVAIGNEVSNGMMWGSEYDLLTPYVDRQYYYTSGRYKAQPGGGVKWLKYEEAKGDVESPAYREFLESVHNLALLIDSGNRAVREINAKRGAAIKTQLHFAFNVYEKVNGQMVSVGTERIFKRAMTLIGALNKELSARSGMVDAIGISYYPDWHGSYDTLQQYLVEISRALPNVKVNIAECSPSFRGSVEQAISNLNHPVGFAYSIQSQGDDSIDLMKTVNDVPNNAGTGVWPWAGTRVFGTGRGDDGTLRASFKAWNDAFAKNVLEDCVSVAAIPGQTPKLPATVHSLDQATGQISEVPVKWEPMPANVEAGATSAVHGEAQMQASEQGRGKAMTQVTAIVNAAASPPPREQQQGRSAPPFSSPPELYSGVSGPGEPVQGDGLGGWRSGRDGVRYKGPHPKPGWQLDWDAKETSTDQAIESELLPPIKPIWELHLRDTIINLGGDGLYYMTGSSGDNIWDRNDGVELWRSPDMKAWEYVGLVWSMDKDATWQKAARFVWAPEIHYLKSKKTYVITLCVGGGASGGGLLVSTTGKPEGPYVNPFKPDARATGGIDPTVFEDDDGKIYYTWGHGDAIYQLKDDLSGFVDGPHRIQLDAESQAKALALGVRSGVGSEGPSLFKREGKYYLGGAHFIGGVNRQTGRNGRYSSCIAISDHIYGPYAMWEEAAPCGAGGNYFQAKDGQWYCTYFGNDEASPFREKPGLVRIDFQPDGRIKLADEQPAFLLRDGAPSRWRVKK